MDSLTIALIATVDLIFLVIYGIFIIVQIHKRNKASLSLDGKMHNYGRIIMWSAVIGIVLVNRGISDGTYSVIFLTILLLCLVVGSRLFALSYKIEQENKNIWYYSWDQWLLRIYKKYLEPVGKK